MPRGVFTVVMPKTTFTTANGDYDIWELVPADDKPIEIVALKVANKTEVGDAQEEMVEWAIVRGNTTAAASGTSRTPVPTDPAEPGNASFTAVSNATTPASTAGSTLLQDTFNIRGNLNEIYPPELRFKCSQAEARICVRLLTALADDADLISTIWVREL
jgi:hypothetical protein